MILYLSLLRKQKRFKFITPRKKNNYIIFSKNNYVFNIYK